MHKMSLALTSLLCISTALLMHAADDMDTQQSASTTHYIDNNTHQSELDHLVNYVTNACANLSLGVAFSYNVYEIYDELNQSNPIPYQSVIAALLFGAIGIKKHMTRNPHSTPFQRVVRLFSVALDNIFLIGVMASDDVVSFKSTIVMFLTKYLAFHCPQEDNGAVILEEKNKTATVATTTEHTTYETPREE